MQRPRNIVSVDAVEWTRSDQGAIGAPPDDRFHRFQWRRAKLGAAAGGQLLGASLYELLPGHRLFPVHYHWANEEALYVVEGSGTLTVPEGDFPIAAGDYAAFPRGPAGSHQVLNTSSAPLRVLIFSTMIHPDVVVHPRNGKVLIFAGGAPGGPPEGRTLQILRGDAGTSFWEGEE